MNWLTANYSERCHKTERCSRFIADSRYIIAINSTLSVTLINRWTLESEPLPVQSNDTLTELTHLALNEDIIFCCYRDGTITAWSIANKSVLYHFQNESMRGCDFKCCVAHGLIVSFVSVTTHSSGGCQTRFCVRHTQNYNSVVMEETTNRLPCARIKEVLFDSTYFVVFLFCSNNYIVSNEDFKIQLRSANTFETLREISGIMSSDNKFSYFNGWLAVGTSRGLIRVWEVEKQLCHHSIQIQGNMEIVDLSLNDEHVITRDVSGMFMVFPLPSNMRTLETSGANHVQLQGEPIRRGYQTFRSDYLQIITVRTCEDYVNGHHDLVTLKNFFD